MYNYSIIIPYGNKYDLMLKAVDSIPDRADIQIILVDNGAKYLEDSLIPHKNMTSLEYYRSDNTKGAGCARNEGLKHVKGKYILFLDADDYFTEEAFVVFDKYLDKKFDIVFFKPTSIRLGSDQPSSRHLLYSIPIDNHQLTGNEDVLRYRFEVPWSKLYNAKFIFDGSFSFEEIKVNNDAWFSLQTGHFAGKITSDKTIVYVVTEGEPNMSLVKTKTPENLMIRYCSAIKINKFLKSINKEKMRIRLLGFLKIALVDFGFFEMLKFLKIAYKEKVSVF